MKRIIPILAFLLLAGVTCPAISPFFFVSTFTEANIPGKIAMYDASVASNITLSGSNVTQWNDPVGGYNVTNGAGSTQPTYSATAFNGHPTIVFSGAASTYNFLVNNSFSISQPNFTVAVCQYTGSTLSLPIVYDSTTVGARQAIYNAGTSPFYLGFYATTTTVTSTTAVSTTTNCVVGVFNGASSVLYSNGATAVSGNPGTLGMTGLRIGCNYAGNGQPNHGYLSELILCSGTPSAALLANIRALMKRKWGTP
jgi:hypothetical protein